MARCGKRIPGEGARNGVRKYWKNKVCFLAALWIGMFVCQEKMTVNAEPASLQSDSAVIYGGMDEAGAAVGNLVRGSSFELIGSVTAEDGSSWYHVAAFGVEGYIKGNAQIERGQAETAGDHAAQTGEGAGAAGENTEGNGETAQPGDNAARTGENAVVTGADAAVGGDAVGTGNGTAAGGNAVVTGAEAAAGGSAVVTGVGTATGGNAVGAGAAGGDNLPGEETAGEAEGTEAGISGNPAGGYPGTNTREKTYTGGENSLKNRETEAMAKDAGADGKGDESAAGSRAKTINTTVLFFVTAAAGSVLTALVSYKMLRRELSGRENAGGRHSDYRTAAGDKRAIHRKKKHKKKKGKSKKNGNTKRQQI